MLLRYGVLIAGLIGMGAIGWGEETKPAINDGDVRTWVAQLNDDDYAVREEAARRLTTAGAAAVDGLVDGLASDQAEVAWRCGAALEQIAVDADDATVDRIAQKIDAACTRTGREGLKSLAKDLQARQKQFRRDRAIAVLRKNGGQIAGSGIDGGAEFGGGFMAFPAIAPAIVIDGPIVEMEAMAIPVPAGAVEPELPRVEVFDLFAEIGRVIGRVVAPADAAPTDVAPADVVPADVAPADVAPVEPAPEGALKKADEAAVPRDAEAAEREALEKAAKAAEEAAVSAKEAAVEAVDVAVAAVAVGDVAVAMEGGMLGDPGGWAQLRLDANWRGGDEALSVLKDLPELNLIDLQETKLTDKALAHFAALPRLQQLSLYRTSFSRDALLQFHRKRQSVVIYARGEAMMGIHGDMTSSPLVLTSVQDGTGAAQAGLQPGDVVHQIDGVKIRDFSELTICVSARKSADKIKVEYERGGAKKTIEVTLSPRTE